MCEKRGEDCLKCTAHCLNRQECIREKVQAPGEVNINGESASISPFFGE